MIYLRGGSVKNVRTILFFPPHFFRGLQLVLPERILQLCAAAAQPVNRRESRQNKSTVGRVSSEVQVQVKREAVQTAKQKTHTYIINHLTALQDQIPLNISLIFQTVYFIPEGSMLHRCIF